MVTSLCVPVGLELINWNGSNFCKVIHWLLLYKSKLTSITIDIDSSVVNVEGHKEGTARGVNPKKPSNLWYNLQFALCDELKAYITGFVRSGNIYTANGAAEMIKEIVANIKTDDLEIVL